VFWLVVAAVAVLAHTAPFPFLLDVTGNNIANVNTTAFKASATQFQDTLSQMSQGAGGPQAQVGGTNPAQIGLGVQVAGISTNFAQGSAQSTGRSTDIMISGDPHMTSARALEPPHRGGCDLDRRAVLSLEGVPGVAQRLHAGAVLPQVLIGARPVGPAR